MKKQSVTETNEAMRAALAEYRKGEQPKKRTVKNKPTSTSTQTTKLKKTKNKPTSQPCPKPQEALQIEQTASEMGRKKLHTPADYPGLYDSFRSHDADSTHATEEVEPKSASKNFTPEPYLFPSDEGIAYVEPAEPVAYEAPRRVRTKLHELSEEEKKSRRKKIISIVSALVVIGLGLIFAFTLHEWWQWQHVIGSFGGAASLVVVALAVIFVGALIREQSDDYEKECIVALAMLLVANTVLTFVLAGKYYVISYWINGWMVVAGLFMCAGCLATDKKGLAIPFAVETLGAITVIVLRANLPL